MLNSSLALASEGHGVLDMALLSVIRRRHYRDHLSIREIVRRTGLSRNTIRKYLRSDTVEPQFKVPDRPSKLDPFAERKAPVLLVSGYAHVDDELDITVPRMMKPFTQNRLASHISDLLSSP